MRTLFSILVAFLAFLAFPAFAQQETPSDARVFFVDIKDGDEVTAPFVVRMGAEGVKPVRAGLNIPRTGHHHLLINAELGDEDRGFAIPEDLNHRHLSAGQSEITLNLRPGRYSLQLVFGDGDHVPYEPFLQSDKIFITVVE